MAGPVYLRFLATGKLYIYYYNALLRIYYKLYYNLNNLALYMCAIQLLTYCVFRIFCDRECVRFVTHKQYLTRTDM